MPAEMPSSADAIAENSARHALPAAEGAVLAPQGMFYIGAFGIAGEPMARRMQNRDEDGAGEFAAPRERSL